MPEHPQIEELANAASAGLLAEEMVFAMGRILRGEPLDQSEERESVALGKAVLESLTSSDLTIPPPEGMSQLAADDEALDALHAVMIQAPERDVREYLGRLVDVLDLVLKQEDVSSYQAELEALQELFATLGSITLARANSLSKGPEERLTWPISVETSAS